MQKDLFGNEIVQVSSKKKSKPVIKSAEKVEHKKIVANGLNEIYKDFGNYIVNGRGNKTL